MAAKRRYPAALRNGALVVLAAVTLAACATADGLLEDLRPAYAWLIRPEDRTEADRLLDERRKPAQLIEFYDLRPGMRVLDMGTGAGYNAE